MNPHEGFTQSSHASKPKQRRPSQPSAAVCVRSSFVPIAHSIYEGPSDKSRRVLSMRKLRSIKLYPASTDTAGLLENSKPGRMIIVDSARSYEDTRRVYTIFLSTPIPTTPAKVINKGLEDAGGLRRVFNLQVVTRAREILQLSVAADRVDHQVLKDRRG